MAIPRFDQFLLPILKLLSDGNDHQLSDLRQHLSKQFKLSAAELGERLPSGKQTVVENRIGWAITYLTKAVIIERTGHGQTQITARGQELLKKVPTEVNVETLRAYPEFLAFQQSKKKKVGKTPAPAEQEDLDFQNEDKGEQVPFFVGGHKFSMSLDNLARLVRKLSKSSTVSVVPEG